MVEGKSKTLLGGSSKGHIVLRAAPNAAPIEDVPILGAHLWYDRPVLAESHAALVEGPLQWLFRKDVTGTAVHGVISAARAWAGRPKEEALAAFTRQINATFPVARGATLVRGVVVVEKRATFSPSPGIDVLRPQR